MTISDYLSAVKERLLTDEIILHFEVLRERATQIDGFIRARTFFIDSTGLEFSEYFHWLPDSNIKIITYSYHWSDPTGKLIFRWDNTPHFPGLPDFPHHIHIGESELAIPGKSMSIFTVLDEIARHINLDTNAPDFDPSAWLSD